MKTSKLIFLLSVISLVSFAQVYGHEYVISNIHGNVFYKSQDSLLWDTLMRWQSVKSFDSVYIKDTPGWVDVRDILSNQPPYRSQQNGKMTIFNIVDADKKKQLSFLHAILKRFYDNLKSQKIVTPSMNTIGAEEAKGTSTQNDEIADAFMRIARRVLIYNEDSNQSLLYMSAIQSTNYDTEYSYFVLNNQDTCDYYVNILHLNKRTKKVNLCYIPNNILDGESSIDLPIIYLPSKTKLNIEGIFFKTGTREDVYIMVGTQVYFLPNNIQSRLKAMKLDDVHFETDKLTKDSLDVEIKYFVLPTQ